VKTKQPRAARRAQDTTLVNLRAIKERVLRLEDEVAILTSAVEALRPSPPPFDPPDAPADTPETTEA
jgi:hypothetical protein